LRGEQEKKARSAEADTNKPATKMKAGNSPKAILYGVLGATEE
jgi:hypothetical protein